MVTLPRLLYHFETLPVKVPPPVLKMIQKKITKFIWGSKKHRISHKILSTPISCGGLGAPDIHKYYLASHLRQAAAWSDRVHCGKWVTIENDTVQPYTIPSLLWNTTIPSEINEKLLNSIKMTLTIWKQAKSHHNFIQKPYRLTPIFGNPSFPPGVAQQYAKPWKHIGLTQLRDFYDGLTHKIYSFQDLQRKFGLTNSLSYQYLQIHHFVQQLGGTQLSLERSLFDSIVATRTSRRGLISSIYCSLTTPEEKDFAKHSYMLKWEHTIGKELSFTEWSKIWDNLRKTSACVTHKETNYKILMHWYMTPVRLHTIYPNSPSTCWRQCGEEGTIEHIFWRCPAIREYWTQILTLLESLLGGNLQLDPLTFLLGSPFPKTKNHLQKLANLILTAAKRLIARHWKKTTSPTSTELENAIWDIRRMEYIAALHQSRTLFFNKIWQPWDSLHPLIGQSGTSDPPA
uniref:Reverse transcriptase zinc-binding domain-containing protein n=1 Tax=Xenopus tropicalis TaxID=8364 RepID=A0A803JGN5_XENTR